MDVHLSAASPVLDCSLLGEITPALNMEGGMDESLEWLSIYVEDCLSSSTSYYNCTTFPSFLSPKGPPPLSSPEPAPPLEDLAAPANGTSKRRRVTRRNNSHVNPSDTLLLHQTCWLADSELLLPPKKAEEGQRGVLEGERKWMKDQGVVGQQPRKCTHCLSQKTPQWRAGPLGPKTLCNACGVRFMSGRLLPEYRPAKSPTFVSYKHSNVHKKVLEMRKSVLPSSSS